MKLASLKDGRDGRLVVVSRDLKRFLYAAEAAPSGPKTLQAALDGWADARPVLEELSKRVNAGEGEPFDQACTDALDRPSDDHRRHRRDERSGDTTDGEHHDGDPEHRPHADGIDQRSGGHRRGGGESAASVSSEYG